MTITQFNIASASWFRPELALTAGILLLFLLDVLVRKQSRYRVAVLTVAALACVGVAAALLAFQPVESRAMFNGMIASDPFATFWKWLFLGAAALTVLIAARSDEFPSPRIGVFYALLLSVVLGMFLMATSLDLLMLYLAIEMVSLPSYAIAGYKPGDRRAAEASLKYVIYGGVASGIMLFGLSYIYGLVGSTNLTALGVRLESLAAPASAGGQLGLRVALMVAVIFVLCGIGYKIAAVPWHMWCPDVYEGAPTPFVAFLSVGPKAAGFALAVRVFYSFLASGGGPEGFARGLADVPWPAVVGVLSAVTMTLGNLSALHQNNLKRLLAYSSISHAGYALMGLAAASQLGVQSVMIYMLVYLVMNLGAFLAVIAIAQATGSETIADCNGLSRRHPLLAVTFAVFLFSLTGLPPLAGFVGKWYLFVAVLSHYAGDGGAWYVTLAVIAALNTAISLYYYVRIIRAMFIEAPAGELVVRPRVSYQIMLGTFSAALLLFGVWWNPLIEWTQASLTFLTRG
ncbi:MAG: NADH-quinone oxidoreductase subunit N [Deltaproteobacteria bacterium]|nr:NADH-quinone oxidoreductase subunit N [Deltaproteobacteria bacterium]